MYKLLIVDDEVIERDAIKYIVSQNFTDVFEVCEAANGREMIERAVGFKPDIILTDIKMPGISGLEAAAKLRESVPECRIIIMSAFNYFNYAKDALALGVDDFIIKPVPEETVVDTLNKAIKNIEDRRAKKQIEEEINNRLKNVIQYLEEELVLLMSSGEIEEKAIKEFFDILNIRKNIFICTAIAFSDRNLPDEIGGEVQKRILKKRVIERIKDKLTARGVQFFIGTAGRYIQLLILADNEMDEYESRVLWGKTLSEIKDEIFDDIHICLNIGIGSQCKSISQVFNSFMQAKIALKYDPAPGAVISYGDISKENYNIEYPINKEKQLLEFFLQGDEKKSFQLIDELVDWMTVNLQKIENIRQKIYELLVVLMREAVMNLSLIELDTDSEIMRKNLYLLDTTRELRAFIKRYVGDKITDINGIKASRVNSLLSMVKEYISVNFDKDISLESVSDIIKVSPFYLSKLFKKETDMNFIDYLTEFRIRKAKELLTIPTNNVKDVCFLVGYKDPNYFARVFKKISNATPTEYREKMLGKG